MAGVDVHVLVPVGAYSNVTVARPEPPVSLALAPRATVAATWAPSVGLVMETVGGVASTVHVRERDALVLPWPSRARTSKVCEPCVRFV